MRKRKLVFIFLIVVIILTLSTSSVFAATYYYSSGYELYHNNSVEGWCINSCSLNDDEISLPGELLNENVSSVGGRCFENRNTLRYIYFPDSIKELGAYSFSGCTSLSEIVIGTGLEKIYVGAFRYCDSIISLDFSNTNLKLIANTAFYRCQSLEEVVLPNTVESIGANAFADCSKLRNILIGKNVSSIGENAFNNDFNLTIQGYMDSYAEEYADSKGIDFEAIDAIVGDANYDKTLNIQDVTAIQKYKAGLTTLSKSGLKAADVTGDGEVSVRDATQIQRYLANIITDF